MELKVHLVNGSHYSFHLADGAPTVEFFATVKHWEVFDRPVLRVHDGKDTWTFNPSAIERIDFSLEGGESQHPDDPKWRSPDNIISSKCISTETYQRKSASLKAREPSSVKKEADSANVLLQIALASGALLYFESFLMLTEPHQQMVNLYRLFQKLNYAIPCEAGGYMILNPKHVDCVRMHPGFSEGQDSAWVVEGFSGSGKGTR